MPTAYRLRRPFGASRLSPLLCLPWLAAIACAQVAGPTTASSAPKDDLRKAAGTEAVELTPFSVSTTLDRGYQAQSTLGGSRLRTDLKDVAAPTTAFTQEFLRDVAVTSTDEIGRYMVSTEYDFGEDGGTGQNFLKDNSTRTMRMRGLTGGTISVNFFKSNFTADTFSIERIDQSRGPNSVLFGIGNPGGIINVSTKRAQLGKNASEVAVQGRAEGGLRLEGDHNQALNDTFAVRVAAAKDNRGSWRNYEFNDAERYYLTGKWRISRKTDLNVDAEKAAITRQIKRTITAFDAYTLWKAAGSNVGTTANPAQQISLLATANTPYVVLDTASGALANWVNRTVSTVRTAVDGNNIPLTDFSVLPKETAVYGPGYDQDTKYSRLGAYLTHAFTSNFNAELAAMRTCSRFATWDPQTASGRTLTVDTNPLLPSGAPNPNVRRTYFDALPQVTFDDERSDAVRAVLSYKMDLGRWGRHTLAGVYEYDFTKVGILVMREQIVSPNAPNLASAVNNNNRVFRRTYVDLTGPSTAIVMAPYNRQALGTALETVSGRTYSTALVPFNANSQLNSFDDRTAIGMLQSAFWGDRIKTIIGASRDDRNDYASTQVLTPVPGFTNGLPTPVRSHTPNNTIARSVTFSGVFQVNDWLGLTYSKASNRGLPNFSGRLNVTGSDLTAFSRPPVPEGRSQDVGIKLDVLKHRLFVTAGYFQTEGARSFNFSNINPSINPIWDALALAGKVPSGTASMATGTTFDSRAQGYEVEATANFTEHWRAFLNYSNTRVTRTNIGSEEIAYVANWRPLWEANQALPLATGKGTIGSQLAAVDAAIFSNFTLADGALPLGQMRHKLNAVTNYDFSSGALKGVTVGGGLRYSSEPVIGYFASGTPSAIVRSAYFGSRQIFFDLNAAYRRNLTLLGKTVKWSLQTNLNNVLNNDAFVRIQQASDGTLVNYRFNSPLEWVVTTRFSF
jgi:outer membrane receptor protein involved in Fe transport